MTRPRLLLAMPMLDPIGLEMLAGHVHLIDGTHPDQRVQDVIGAADYLYIYAPKTIDAEVLAMAPRLRLIVAGGAGYDNIDVAAASRCGVAVSNQPGAGARSVAEYIIGMMLRSAKDLTIGERAVREQRFQDRWGNYHEISGRRIAIFGYGPIGRDLAQICRFGFGMEVLVVTRQAVVDDGVGVKASQAEALRRADFVSINVALAAETRGLVDTDFLRAMKPSAFLIDTSRGGVTDPSALIAALQSGTIAGAALDVFEDEPLPPDSPLLRAPHLFLTPHLSGITIDSSRRLAQSAAQDILRMIDGAPPLGLVAGSLWPPAR